MRRIDETSKDKDEAGAAGAVPPTPRFGKDRVKHEWEFKNKNEKEDERRGEEE